MYAIAAVAICTVMLGCFTGNRDAGAADRWLTAPTKAECERRNVDSAVALLEAQGDTVIRVLVVCERVGT